MLTISALCWLCRQPLWFSHHGICRGCVCVLLAERATACPRCGLPAGSERQPCGRCQLRAPPWHSLLAVGDYRPPLSRLVKKLKYHRETGLASVLARLLWLRWRERAAAGEEKPDLLLNVPLHAYRHWRRGYNQTELLARALARWLRVPWQAKGLFRARGGPPQQRLGARQRRHNLCGAFVCLADVAGKRVALVDDVVTTGSTAGEISRLLLRHDAREVRLWSICRTL
ncbi:phosphoribosyltransferase family protein [Candidatus Sodalis sp. SoCistrobi]|uniref:phosphoribosyltransferase family protein n=1 Tax=Candidatus Sodalis sp. SoCistrobi TaxID=1922216 RepID=UPI00093F9E75|nr:phosphoribosyltransferase family protein [Candidatus Sodalis sp. SoCistrobi]